MEGITLGQILAANWILFTAVFVVVVAIVVWGVVARRRRFRRLPATLGGVRIECQGAHLDEDLIVEQNWRITFLLTNSTRMPRPVPVLSSRATVKVGREKYAGTLYLEREASEINPGDALVAWVLAQLPATPATVTVDEIGPSGHLRLLAARMK